MTKASNNPFPSVLVVEGTTPTSPSAGDQRLFIDSSDHKLKRVDSSGTVTTVEGGGTAGALTKISESVLAASAASITFSSIPGTYRHLQLLLDSRGDAAATSINVNLRFNSDSGANYDYVRLTTEGSVSAPAVGNGEAQTSLFVGFGSAASATAGMSSQVVATILNYAGTTFHKGLRATSDLKQGTTSADVFVADFAGWWRSTAAITSITILPSSGNFIAGTVASLYGLS